MLTYPKSTMRVRRMSMHLSSGHVTGAEEILPPPLISPQSDLGRRADSRWALPLISSSFCYHNTETHFEHCSVKLTYYPVRYFCLLTMVKVELIKLVLGGKQNAYADNCFSGRVDVELWTKDSAVYEHKTCPRWCRNCTTGKESTKWISLLIYVQSFTMKLYYIY